MARLRFCFNPYENVPIRAPLLSDWLELCLHGKQECVNKMIEMTDDLFLNGANSRYLKWFAGGVGELKSRTRVGGARVYLFRVDEDTFTLTRAECKNEKNADEQLIDWTWEVSALFHQGYEVFL